VAQTGGDYTDPVAAMNDLAAWCGSPSVTNPCLLKVMPGVYDIGSNTVTMADYTAIAGSGMGFTKIVAQGVAINCAGISSQVRDIAIVSNLTGISVGASGISLDNVFIHVENPGSNVILGMEVSGGDVIINGSKIAVMGANSAGIHLGLSGGSVSAKNSDISGTQYGINLGLDNWSSPGNWSAGGYFILSDINNCA